MSDFEREERYIVIKRKHLDEIAEHHIRYWLAENSTPTVECVVVESDWPNYENVWQTVQQVAEGTYDPEELTRLQSELEKAEARADKCQREAQQWRQEARTQSSIVAEIYQELTGKTGEPGDWNGARPLRPAILRKQAEALEAAANKFGNIGIGQSPFRYELTLTLKEEAQRLYQQADKLEKGEASNG